MSAVAVGYVFEDQGAVAFGGVFFAVLDGGFDGENVHAVDFKAGDVLAAFVVFSESGGAVGGGTHSVLVVWEDEVLAGSLWGGGKSAVLSQPKSMGRFQSLAMLNASKTWP